MSLANRPAPTCVAASLAAALSLGGCDCAPDRRAPTAPSTATTRGAESRPAIAYPSTEPAPSASAFQVVLGADAPAALGAATRAGAWSALRRGDEERRSAGNFLCRLETLYGRAPIVARDRVAFVLREVESGLVITAVADASGPSFGGVLPPGERGPDPVTQTSAANVVLELARLLDVTAPRDCAYTIGQREVGVRGGQWY